MSQTPSKAPEQFELWADLGRQNSFLRRFVVGELAAILFLVVALGLMATRPLLAVKVDALGNAELVSPLGPTNEPGPQEAESVARRLAEHLLEPTGGSVQRDLTKAYGLMTARFEAEYREIVRKDTTLAQLEQSNIRAALTFEPGATSVKAERDEGGRLVRYHVQLSGLQEVFRQDAFTEPLISRPILVRVTLLAVSRSQASLNGLLVDYFDKEYPAAARTPTVTTTPVPSLPSAKDSQ